MLGWEPLLSSWMNTLPPVIDERVKTLLEEYFNKMVGPTLQWLRRGGARVRWDCYIFSESLNFSVFMFALYICVCVFSVYMCV